MEILGDVAEETGDAADIFGIVRHARGLAGQTGAFKTGFLAISLMKCRRPLWVVGGEAPPWGRHWGNILKEFRVANSLFHGMRRHCGRRNHPQPAVATPVGLQFPPPHASSLSFRPARLALIALCLFFAVSLLSRLLLLFTARHDVTWDASLLGVFAIGACYDAVAAGFAALPWLLVAALVPRRGLHGRLTSPPAAPTCPRTAGATRR